MQSDFAIDNRREKRRKKAFRMIEILGLGII